MENRQLQPIQLIGTTGNTLPEVVKVLGEQGHIIGVLCHSADDDDLEEYEWIWKEGPLWQHCRHYVAKTSRDPRPIITRGDQLFSTVYARLMAGRRLDNELWLWERD